MDQISDYRQFLKNTFAERAKVNFRYSLRAFARDLGVSPSVLSEVLNGKHGLSMKLAKLIAEKLNLSPYEIDIFCHSVEAQHGRSEGKRDVAKERLERIKQMHKGNQLQVDTFKIISDWYHYAILELTYLKGFKSDASWMSKKLDVPQVEVELGIERLLRLGLLEEAEGKYRATEDFTASTDGIPSEGLKKFHKQLLAKATEAITLQSVDNRDVSALVLSVDKKRLPEAKKWLKDFRRNFNSEFGNDSQRNSVYCLSLQLFELIK